MSKFRMQDNTIIDTDNSTARYECKDDHHDGRNNLCRITGQQWDHQILYRSKKGRYYVVYTSQWQGSTDRAEWVSPEEATRWLLLNGNEIPAELRQYTDTVTE